MRTSRARLAVGLAAAAWAVAAAALPGTALAKMASTRVAIEGPGLASKLVVREPYAFQHADQAELFDAWRVTAEPPDGALGPAYRARLILGGRLGEPRRVVRHVLYPVAAGGPVVFVPPGQGRAVHDTAPAGWREAEEALAGSLRAAGVPLDAFAEPVDSSGAGEADPAEVAVESSGPGRPGPAGEDSPSALRVGLTALGVLAALGLAAAASRPRRGPRPGARRTG